MENEKEREVVRWLGTDRDEKARKILIEHNLRLVVYIAKKFDNTGVGVEDLISIGTIGLIKAINTFNPSKKIKLATYASRCIENEILMYLRRNSKTKMEVSIDEVWTGSSGGKRNDAEGGCGSTWNLSVLYIKTGKENYAQTSDGNGPV